MNTCRDCGVPLTYKNAHRNKTHTNGLASYCLTCERERNRHRFRAKEHKVYRFSIVAPPLRRPPNGPGTGDNVCLRCSDMEECAVLARHGLPVRCEAKDTWDALRDSLAHACTVAEGTRGRPGRA